MTVISGSFVPRVGGDGNLGTESKAWDKVYVNTVNSKAVYDESNIRTYGATGDGETDDSNSILAAIEHFDGADATLLFPRGDYLIGADMTIPENICLKFEKGGKVVVSDTFTLTINGPIEAGLWQIFDGDGTFSVKNGYRPEWYGAKGDGSTDDYAAFVKTLQSQQASSTFLVLSEGVTYNLDTSLTLPKYCTIEGNSATLSFAEDGINLSNVVWTTAKIFNLRIVCRAGYTNPNPELPATHADSIMLGGRGIYTTEGYTVYTHLRNVYIHGFDYGIKSVSSTDPHYSNMTWGKLENVRIESCNYGMYFQKGWLNTFTADTITLNYIKKTAFMVEDVNQIHDFILTNLTIEQCGSNITYGTSPIIFKDVVNGNIVIEKLYLESVGQRKTASAEEIALYKSTGSQVVAGGWVLGNFMYREANGFITPYPNYGVIDLDNTSLTIKVEDAFMNCNPLPIVTQRGGTRSSVVYIRNSNLIIGTSIPYSALPIFRSDNSQWLNITIDGWFMADSGEVAYPWLTGFKFSTYVRVDGNWLLNKKAFAPHRITPHTVKETKIFTVYYGKTATVSITVPTTSPFSSNPAGKIPGYGNVKMCGYHTSNPTLAVLDFDFVTTIVPSVDSSKPHETPNRKVGINCEISDVSLAAGVFSFTLTPTQSLVSSSVPLTCIVSLDAIALDNPSATDNSYITVSIA